LVKLSILQLEKRGKLKLTDLVSKHLNFEESLGDACINHVVFNLIETDFDAYFKIEETYQIHEVLDSKNILRLFVESKEKLTLKDYGINKFYSTKRNTLNIALLIEIIEKVSGESYTSFVKSELLEPLQMNSTIFLNHDKIDLELEKNIVEGIKYSKKETKRLIDSDYTINGLNNLYSCTEDLKKLLNALTTENSNLPESIKPLFSKIEKPYKRYDEKTRDYYIKYGINHIKYSSFDLLELVEHRYGIYENLFLNRSNGDYMLILDNQYTNSNHIQKQLIKLLH